MTIQRYRLTSPANRRAAVQAVACADASMMVELRPQARGLAQNALLHALFADIARQGEWGGRRLTAHQWKVLMISGHAIATGCRGLRASL